MKKVGLILVLMLLLSGCGAQETFETLGDVWSPDNTAQPREVVFTVPAEAAEQTMTGETGRIWFCDGYEITVETLSAGDLGRTVQEISGFHKDAITCMATSSSEVKRYECVWTAAGESGDQVHRAVILDDGSYHYVLTVMALAQEAGSLQESWEAIFGSFALQG